MFSLLSINRLLTMGLTGNLLVAPSACLQDIFEKEVGGSGAVCERIYDRLRTRQSSAFQRSNFLQFSFKDVAALLYGNVGKRGS